jgi:hypothetical protein
VDKAKPLPVKASLVKGDNKLLVKLTDRQSGQAWSLSVRIVDAAGAVVAGIHQRELRPEGDEPQ